MKTLYKIKQIANLAIEQKRTSKEIGSSLEAEIEIKADAKSYKILDGLDLAEYFITSKATKTIDEKNKDEPIIIVKKSEGVKCERCWKVLNDKCARCEKISSSVSK